MKWLPAEQLRIAVKTRKMYSFKNRLAHGLCTYGIKQSPFKRKLDSSNKNKDLLLCPFLQERLSHGISSSGFPGNHRTSDFPPTYFPPPFPSQQPTPQEVFAAQNAHLDPYTNSLHSFQATQVRT